MLRVEDLDDLAAGAPGEQEPARSMPPPETRFKPGRSGNPRGRPRGARSRRKIVEEVAYELLEVKDGEKRVRRSAVELVLRVVRKLAMQGHPRAIKAFHELQQRYQPEDVREQRGYLIVPEQARSIEEWEAFAAVNKIPKPGFDELWGSGASGRDPSQ